MGTEDDVRGFERLAREDRHHWGGTPNATPALGLAGGSAAEEVRGS